MIEAPLIFLFILMAILVGAVLFIVWLLKSICGAILDLFFPSRRRAATQFISGNVQRCTNKSCQTENPVHARFCRRCGYSLPNLLKIHSDSAAA